jgi:Tfp pilus assembly pilus retraction ATPase PilT
MQTLDQSLAALAQQGLIDSQTVRMLSITPQSLGSNPAGG